MEPEQCVEMMQVLRDAYRKVAEDKHNISNEQVYDLKHVLTEIKMCIISMTNSIDKMQTRINR